MRKPVIWWILSLERSSPGEYSATSEGNNILVYQYATGISAAHALSRRILSGAPGAAEDYLRFLSTGGSLEALKLAGADLPTPQPVEETFSVLAEFVNRVEKLLEISD